MLSGLRTSVRSGYSVVIRIQHTEILRRVEERGDRPFLRGGAGTDPSAAVNPEVSPACGGVGTDPSAEAAEKVSLG